MQTKFSKRIVHCPYEEEPVKTPCQRCLIFRNSDVFQGPGTALENAIALRATFEQ